MALRLALGSFSLLIASTPTIDVAVGDSVAHRFQREVWNAPGLGELAQWNGRVVAVVTFDVDSSESVKLVRLFADLQAKHAPHLQVLMAPRGASDEKLLPIVIRERWLSAGLAWTTEDVLQGARTNGVRTVVVDPSGQVAAISPTLEPKTVERSVREAVEALESALGYAPDPLMSAYRRMQKGEVQGAFAYLVELESGKVDGTSDMIRNLADVSATWWRPATFGRRDRVAKLLGESRFQEAQRLMDELLDEFPGVRKADDPFAQEVREQLAILEAKPKNAVPDERKADQELDKVLATLRKRGTSKSVLSKLESVVTKYEGTQAGQRAARWLGWASHDEDAVDR